MNAGYGLTVRWSLEDSDPAVGQKLRDYVIGPKWSVRSRWNHVEIFHNVRFGF